MQVPRKQSQKKWCQILNERDKYHWEVPDADIDAHELEAPLATPYCQLRVLSSGHTFKKIQLNLFVHDGDDYDGCEKLANCYEFGDTQ